MATLGGLLGGFRPGARVEAATPKVAIQPKEVIPSATIAVQGAGYPKRSRGQMIWVATGKSLGGFQTNKQGRFATTVRLPQTAPGKYGIVAKIGRAKARTAVQVSRPNGGPVALGMFQPGAPGTVALDRLKTQLGRNPEIVMWYQHWGLNATKELMPRQLTQVANRGSVPMITWEPWDPTRDKNQPVRFKLTNLCTRPNESANKMQKANNAYIDDWATKLAAYGKPVLLRFAHEMNGTWYPWAAGVNGNTAGEYKEVWQCLRARFAEKGATNVEWIWSPNISFSGSTAMGSLYPGDAAVDWLGLDGYNFGGSDWRSFARVFDASLNELKQLSSKKVMIAESASAEQGGSKATWIRMALLNSLPLDYPQVRAIVWFNQNKEQDWRFSSSLGSRDAFRQAVKLTYYNGAV